MPDATRDWNVLTDCWLEVMDLNAQPQILSPLQVLDRAGGIRCITAASPLDWFAAHRFLLTLLYWKADAAGGVPNIRRSLLRGKVPKAALDAISKEDGRFRLFDDQEPFLQDSSARTATTKSAGSLFAEFACGTNIAHFHHGDDKRMRLCLPCATVGMLRVIPWSQSGGRGLSPAVHNAPPIVATALGENLAVTLGLNLVELDGKAGEATWTGHFKPTAPESAIPYLEALTWNPRRVHLRSARENGICWRCGQGEVPVVGPIVYEKNVNTKLIKKAGKTIPFVWKDPSAFYRSDGPYITIKSYDEAQAADGRDLAGLSGRDDSPPASIVVTKNLEHECWRVVIPCTNPANNKTFDHRLMDLPRLTPNEIAALVPAKPSRWRQQEVDGWKEPHGNARRNGAVCFIESALRLLTHGDWAVLSGAAYRSMHESPAGFDLLTGLLWPLRNRAFGLPSRNVAWLVLKLMGAIPSRWRELSRQADQVCPLDDIPKRQLNERRGERSVRSPYPVLLPRGHRLEAALRGALDRHLRRREARPIDWPSLCCRLESLLNR